MAIFVHPVTTQRIVYNPMTDDDIVVQREPQSDVVSKQDLFKLGTYVDDNGNTVKVLNPLMQGQANKLQGTIGGFRGKRDIDRTPRGNPRATTYTIARKDYIQFR